GELYLRYELRTAEGNAVLLGFDPSGGAAPLRSRPDMNIIDFTFPRARYGRLWDLLWFVNGGPPKTQWGGSWGAGARLAAVFYDLTALGAQRGRHVSDFFVGGGPLIGLQLHRLLGESGLKLLGRVDVGVNMGTSHQQFSQLEVSPAGAPTGFGYAASESFRAVPTLAVLAGLGGDAMMTRRGSWQAGYQFGEWFNFGRGGGSAANLRPPRV